MAHVQFRWIIPKRTIGVDGIEVLPILQQRGLVNHALHPPEWSNWITVPVAVVSDGYYVSELKRFTSQFPKRPVDTSTMQEGYLD